MTIVYNPAGHAAAPAPGWLLRHPVAAVRRSAVLTGLVVGAVLGGVVLAALGAVLALAPTPAPAGPVRVAPGALYPVTVPARLGPDQRQGVCRVAAAGTVSCLLTR